MIKKILYLLLCFCLLFEQTGGLAQSIGELNLAGYFSSLRSSFAQDKFRPLHLRYLSYDSLANNFHLLLDKGDTKALGRAQLEETTQNLLHYFFIGIALPNESFWVNLRPDSQDNIIDPELAKTDVGKILLEADLQLKKDTAKFTSPATPEGRKYWDKLYKKAGELFGYDSITIPTLTRPWIVPGEIIIRETNDNAYIYKATLKVCLEQDYLKGSSTYNFKDPRLKALNDYSSQLIRELILPKITKEVNLAQRYASLRQVYYSLILAQWFKAKFNGRSGLYASLINRKNLIGILSKSFWSKTTYFQEYQKSFQKGEYNLKEPIYTPSGQTIRSYFSGGMDVSGCYATAATDKGLIHPAQGKPLVPMGGMLPGEFDSTETPYAGTVSVHEGAPLPPGGAQAARGQSRSGASSTPAGSPLNVFDVLLQEGEALTLAEIAELVKRSPATLAPDVRALVRWGIARKDGSGENAQYAVVPLSPLQVTDIRQTLAGLPRARPTKAEVDEIVPAIGQILARTALVSRMDGQIQFPADNNELAQEIESLNIGLSEWGQINKSPKHERAVIDSYPEAERDVVANLITPSRIFSMTRRHALRLLEYERTEVEKRFARALFKFYDPDKLESRVPGYIEPRFPGAFIVMQTEGCDTMLFWTVAPYLYSELVALELDEEVAFEAVCAWVDPRVNDDYRDWYRFLGGGYLIGLDLFIEPFVLLSGTDIREQEMQGSHRCAGLIARYVLGKREFQNIVLETLVRWQQNTYDESSQRAPLGQSRSGASSTPAGSPLNVFDVLLQEREALTLAEIAELVKRSPATLAPDVRALVRWGIARKDGSGENAQYAVVPLSPLQVTDIRQTLAGLPRARPTKAEIEKISPTIGQILGRTANTPYIFEQLTVASSGKTKASRQIAFGTLVSEATAHPEVFETLLTIFKDTRYYRIVSTYRTTVASVILSLLRDIETSSGNLPLAANMLYYFCAKWVFSGYFSAGTLDSEFARDRHKIAEKLIEQLDLGHLSEGMRIMQANLDAEAVLQHELRHILRGMLFAIDSAHGPELVKYDSTIHELINAIFVEFSIFSNRLEDEASRTGRAQFSAEIPALVLRNRGAVVSALQQLLNNFSREFLSTETQLSASEQEAVVKIRRLLSLADKKLRSYLRDPEDAYGEPQNIDIIQIAQEAMEYYSNNKKISFRLQAPENQIFVRMDELLALEVFFNLIKNAIDEIGRGEGEITVSITRDGGWVRVEVIDTGGGISEEIESRIFEPHFTTKESGRGIGLYLCRRYIEAASGHITGTNRSDGIKGAVFTVTLPLHEPSSVDPGSSKPKGIAPEHGTSPAKASDLGGIDFRELPMVTQPMKVPAVNLPAPLMNQIDNLNLDVEWTQIRRMLDAGIIPSTERIKEYLQARYQKGITSREIELVLSGIACILRLEEKYIYATDPALKELLVHLESGLPG